MRKPKIISMRSDRSSKRGFITRFWKQYNSLDFIIRLSIPTIILIALVTPFIVNNLQIFNQNAQTPSISPVYFGYDLTFDHKNNPVAASGAGLNNNLVYDSLRNNLILISYVGLAVIIGIVFIGIIITRRK